MKKTIFCILMSIIAILTFAGCGDGNDETPNTKGTSNTEEITYIVKWVDENGNTISSDSVKQGEIPSCNYSVTDTAEWDYTFNGWSTAADGEVLSSIPAVTSNVTYYAQVSAVKQKYTVVFHSNGGSSVASQVVEYGDRISLPEEPIYDGHKFMGWSSDPDELNIVDFDKTITGNVEYYAVWKKLIDVKGLLKSLLGGYVMDPFIYLPDSMKMGNGAKVVEKDKIVSDYSNFVNTSDICYGYGEQWHMVLSNLNQTKTFYNVLSVIDELSTASITAFNNYFDSNPSDTAHYEFGSGIYNVTINFDGLTLTYILDYTAEIPTLGTQTVQIALAMDSETGEKKVRMQLGDANALTYTVLENSYEFAIKYLDSRKAFFSISRDENGDVSGKIYEYLTIASVEVASAATFYITEEYISVIGNKASGMVGFEGYINELYDTKNGHLIGYEVQEKLSGIVYNTLWFNLNDIKGITSLMHQLSDDDSTIYINGSDKKWEAKTVGGIGSKMFSRRFDIEFRTQYVYFYDSAEEKYVEYEIKVPMIFVQEENFDTFVTDVYEKNSVNVTLTVSAKDVNKILKDYDELIPEFIKSKDVFTPDMIEAYIGEKYQF